jgi:hypothetical protein
VDALVAGIVGIVICASMTVAAEPSSRRVDLIAYLLGLAAGLLLVRRRWPVPVLAGSALLIITYHVLDHPAIGLAFPLVAALYSAAVAGAIVGAAAVPPGRPGPDPAHPGVDPHAPCPLSIPADAVRVEGERPAPRRPRTTGRACG